jgi:hypothetical protein
LKSATAVLFCIAIALLAAGGSSCSDDGIGPNDEIVFPDSAVSYVRHVQPFLTFRCAVYGCHDDDTRAGGCAFTNYLNTTAKPGVVRKGSGETSMLYQRVSGLSPHQSGLPVIATQNQIKGIKRWIDEGGEYN